MIFEWSVFFRSGPMLIFDTDLANADTGNLQTLHSDIDFPPTDWTGRLSRFIPAVTPCSGAHWSTYYRENKRNLESQNELAPWLIQSLESTSTGKLSYLHIILLTLYSRFSWEYEVNKFQMSLCCSKIQSVTKRRGFSLAQYQYCLLWKNGEISDVTIISKCTLWSISCTVVVFTSSTRLNRFTPSI